MLVEGGVNRMDERTVEALGRRISRGKEPQGCDSEVRVDDSRLLKRSEEQSARHVESNGIRVVLV